MLEASKKADEINVANPSLDRCYVYLSLSFCSLPPSVTQEPCGLLSHCSIGRMQQVANDLHEPYLRIRFRL